MICYTRLPQDLLKKILPIRGMIVPHFTLLVSSSCSLDKVGWIWLMAAKASSIGVLFSLYTVCLKEWRNTPKKILDEEISKICKKFNSRNGFLRHTDGAKKCWIGLQVDQIFAHPLSSRHEKDKSLRINYPWNMTLKWERKSHMFKQLSLLD